MARVTWLALPFLVGCSIGLALWERIALPFWNPSGIVSPLTLARFNPLNNTVRFALLLACPLAALALALAAVGPVRRALCAAPKEGEEREPLSFPEKRPWPWYAWAAMFAAVALSVGLNRSARLFELDTFHEGESLGAAVAWEAGRRPYRDIVFVHGVYQDPLRAVVAFNVLGRSIGAVRTFESIEKLAAYGLMAGVVAGLFGGVGQSPEPYWAF